MAHKKQDTGLNALSAVKQRPFFIILFSQDIHLPLTKIFQMMYCWAQEYSVHNSSKPSIRHVNIGWKTKANHQLNELVTMWKLTKVYYTHTSWTPKEKNNVGRLLPEVWVFGGVCRETHERFVFQVPQRDAATLLPIIQQMILPGSTIHSDGWAANFPTSRGLQTFFC